MKRMSLGMPAPLILSNFAFIELRSCRRRVPFIAYFLFDNICLNVMKIPHISIRIKVVDEANEIFFQFLNGSGSKVIGTSERYSMCLSNRTFISQFFCLCNTTNVY